MRAYNPDETGSTDFFYNEKGFTEGAGFEDNDGNPGLIYPVVDFLKIVTFGTLSAKRYKNVLKVTSEINLDVYTTNPNVDKCGKAKAMLSIWDDNGGSLKLLNGSVETLIRNNP